MKSICICLETSRFFMDPEGYLSNNEFDASCEAYLDAIRDAVVCVYPDAEIAIAPLIHGGRTGIVCVGFDDDAAEIRIVSNIVRDVWNEAEFWPSFESDAGDAGEAKVSL